jgi:hypothetical protein
MRSQNGNWRKQFRITGVESCARGKAFAPGGLIAHLKELGLGKKGTIKVPCTYHWIVYLYLESLYEDYWGRGLKHKAFYQLGDDYNAAVVAQTREQQWYVVEFAFGQMGTLHLIKARNSPQQDQLAAGG